MTTTERGLSLRLQKEAIFDKNAYSFIDMGIFNQIIAEFEQSLFDCEASNKAVEKALEDVEYSGSYADGVLALKQRLVEAEQRASKFDAETQQYLAERNKSRLAAEQEFRDRIKQLEGVVAGKNEALAWALNCIDNPTDESPSAFVDGYHRAEKALALTAAQPAEQQHEPKILRNDADIDKFFEELQQEQPAEQQENEIQRTEREVGHGVQMMPSALLAGQQEQPGAGREPICFGVRMAGGRKITVTHDDEETAKVSAKAISNFPGQFEAVALYTGPQPSAAVPDDLDVIIFTLRDKAGEHLVDNEEDYEGRLMLTAAAYLERLAGSAGREE